MDPHRGRRHPRRRQDRRGAAVRAAARQAGRGRGRRQREARASGRLTWRTSTACRRCRSRRPSPRPRTLVIAVKPQDIDPLLAELREVITPEHLVVSVAAGHHHRANRDGAAAGVAVVRCMPNTPALVDEAMTAVAAGAHADEAHLAIAESLLAAVGRVVRVPESQLDAVTALSGSGPAYFFFLVEAMIDAGILLGPAAGAVGRVDRADRDRLGGDAARLRRAPRAAARGGDQPRRAPRSPRSANWRCTGFGPRCSPRSRRPALRSRELGGEPASTGEMPAVDPAFHAGRWADRWGSTLASAPLVPLIFSQHVRVRFVGGEADALTRAESVGET